ncbi:RNA ligase family protein [Micromonospora avicenniae]|uniref:RNA ligase family protein n=1 Tax=Micromonospora avicenniae TaxID=1198245 RepID=UPI00331E470F
MSDTYPAFPKIPRFHRQVTITEKIDGTNGLIEVRRWDAANTAAAVPGVNFVTTPDGVYTVRAGSRNRWLAPGADNHGFAAWVAGNATELVKLGEGNHYGEWYGKGIQRGYNRADKAFALFNVGRWYDPRHDEPDPRTPKARPCPEVVTVVPVLWIGNAYELNNAITASLAVLHQHGSIIEAGFMNPEGVIVFHEASRTTFKVLIEGDERPKGAAA